MLQKSSFGSLAKVHLKGRGGKKMKGRKDFLFTALDIQAAVAEETTMFLVLLLCLTLISALYFY